MSTAVRGWARAEAASLGILSLTRDVIFASILLLYKLLVIAYRYLQKLSVPYQKLVCRFVIILTFQVDHRNEEDRGGDHST